MLKIPEFSILSDSWLGLLLLAFFFFLFALSVIGWGYKLLGKKEEDFLSQLAASMLGASLFAWFIPTILGSLGAFGAPMILWLLLLAPGLKWALPLLRLLRENSLNNRGWAALFLFIIFVRMLGASVPQAHGDPLLYHLLGPRLWVQHGGFYVNPDLPNAIVASSWEYFYIWPQRFFATANTASALASAHIFSQWIHLIFGWLGLACLLPLLFREAKLGKKWEFLLALAALFLSGIQWTAGLAKNDAGVSFWCLGAVWFLQKAISGKRKSGNLLLAGIFSGLAVTGKVTASLNILFLFLGLLFYFLIKEKKNWKELPRICLLIGAGFLLTALPLYMRNAILTENPFYPMFNSIFPSPWFSPTWQKHFAQVHPSLAGSMMEKFFFRIPELFRESPWIILSLLGLIIFWKERKKSFFPLIIFAHFGLVIFVATQMKEIELRYMGPVLMVLAASGVLFFARLEKKIPASFSAAYFSIFLILCLATSKMPLHILRKQWSSPLGEAYAATHTAGESKRWLRLNMLPEDKVVMAGDNEAYYLSTVPSTILTENPELDRATIGEKDLKNFLKNICSITQARYLLDVRPEIGFVARFGKEAGAKAVIFEAQGSTIYDLAKMNQQHGINQGTCL